jgi:hypothetical protein
LIYVIGFLSPQDNSHKKVFYLLVVSCTGCPTLTKSTKIAIMLFMNKPEIIGPKPLEDLTLREFADAEITAILTTPHVADPEFDGRGGENARYLRYLESLTEREKPFFDVAEEEYKPHVASVRRITSATENLVAGSPDLIKNVIGRLSLMGFAADLLESNLFKLEQGIYNKHKKTLNDLHNDRFRENTDKKHQAIAQKLGASGMAAEPVLPLAGVVRTGASSTAGRTIVHKEYQGG